MNRVPFLDVQAGYRELEADISAAVTRVLARGRYILGEEVAAFESEFAAYVGARHAIGTGNGLDAIFLALAALGIGPGDEVIVPAHTFIATWLAVSRTGARPVPVETCPGACTLDPDRIEESITPRARAIIPVHLYGQPADLHRILAVARRHRLRVVEDAAQAHGARYRGRRVGAHGDAVAWSFYPGKNLGACGDAGAVTTDDPEIAERVRLLGNYGSRRKYACEAIGSNSRLDSIQAAVLRVKLQRLDEWNDRRARIASFYLRELADTELILPESPPWAQPVWHLFVVRSPDRDALRSRLDEVGVETLIHYPTPPHLQEAYRHLGFGPGSFPVTERLCREVLSLPVGPHLGAQEAARVVDVIEHAPA